MVQSVEDPFLERPPLINLQENFEKPDPEYKAVLSFAPLCSLAPEVCLNFGNESYSQ